MRVSVTGPGADGVDAHAFARSFGGGDAREAEHPCFCRGVGGAPRERRLRREARDIKNDAGAARVHFRKDEFAQQERSAQVHGDDVVELRERIVLDGNDRAVVAGIVDEDIDLAEFCAGFGDDARAIRFVSEIADGVMRVPAAAGNFFRRWLLTPPPSAPSGIPKHLRRQKAERWRGRCRGPSR